MKLQPLSNEVEGVDAQTWDRVGSLLMENRGGGLMPHAFSNFLGIPRAPVMAIIFVLGRKKLVQRRYCIYHQCSDAPVDYRDFEDGFQPTPWVCPECEVEIFDPDDLTYDLICVVPPQLDLER